MVAAPQSALLLFVLSGVVQVYSLITCRNKLDSARGILQVPQDLPEAE